MTNLYNIVKEAIDNKIKIVLSSSRYYLKNDILDAASNMLYKKAVVIKGINSQVIHKINTFDDYVGAIKNGAISIYEPVDINTNSFRIKIDNDLPKSQLLNTLKTIRNRFREAGFISDIIKYNEGYGIKCISNKQYNTDKLYSFASEITNGLNCNLSDLQIGNLKRCYYSLNDDGSNDIVINIGENE